MDGGHQKVTGGDDDSVTTAEDRCTSTSLLESKNENYSSIEKQSPGEEKDDSDVTVSLEDVVADAEALEADARAVLGAADDSNCTYPQGYVYRQALYACGTCCPEKLAGVCLACSLHCHDNHQLFELYTKRNFRCDCGNSKFSKENPCRLFQEKEKLNEKNSYNHNFRGLYCKCDRPYPDEEDTIPDEQIQCVICEDWFHSRHLVDENDTAPNSEDYSEMVCRSCVGYLPFLLDYDKASMLFNEDPLDEVVLNKDSTVECVCSKPKPTAAAIRPRSLFLPVNWRKKLCRCEACLRLYRSGSCEFLLSETDPVHYYENEASKSKEGGSLLNSGMKALQQMDRTNQIEMLQEYNSLKSSLTDFLKGFAQKREVVKEEDIKEFFESLKSQKRPRLVLTENCS